MRSDDVEPRTTRGGRSEHFLRGILRQIVPLLARRKSGILRPAQITFQVSIRLSKVTRFFSSPPAAPRNGPRMSFLVTPPASNGTVSLALDQSRRRSPSSSRISGKPWLWAPSSRRTRLPVNPKTFPLVRQVCFRCCRTSVADPGRVHRAIIPVITAVLGPQAAARRLCVQSSMGSARSTRARPGSDSSTAQASTRTARSARLATSMPMRRGTPRSRCCPSASGPAVDCPAALLQVLVTGCEAKNAAGKMASPGHIIVEDGGRVRLHGLAPVAIDRGRAIARPACAPRSAGCKGAAGG